MKVRTTSKLLLKGIEVNSLNNKVKIYKYDIKLNLDYKSKFTVPKTLPK